MSDDSNLTSLEDDDKPAEISAPVAEDSTPPADIIVQPVVADEDPATVDPKDEEKVRGLLAELSRARKAVRDLKPQAERMQQLQAEADQMRPYMDFVKANPDLLKPRAAALVSVPDTTEDPDAIAAAQLYDFYTPEGKPDAKKGAAHLRMVRQEAERITQAALAPIAQRTLQEQSDANFHAVLQMKDGDGRSPSVEAVTAIWKQVLSEPEGLKVTSNREAAAFLAIQSFGIDRMRKGKPAAPPPVLETEASGGVPRKNVEMSAMEQRIAADRGRSPSKWQEYNKGFQPGRPTVLED